jgi:TPR repeat protein
MMSCCCKVICNGCNYANKKREDEQGLEHRCAFCREPAAESQQEYNKNVMERIKKNDPAAMVQMGGHHEKEGDFGKALEYWTKAAELGDVNAHSLLGGLYYNGEGVEKDMKKAVYHWEQAAIGGHPFARACLAVHEKNKGRFDRAAKHSIIAANLGHDVSVKLIKDLFVQGIVSKEDYAAALRGYQAAVNETKSAERDEAEAYYTS